MFMGLYFAKYFKHKFPDIAGLPVLISMANANKY